MYSDDFVNPKSQKFFSDLSNSQAINLKNKNLSENINLKVSINQIKKKCNYNIKLYNTIGDKNYSLNDYSQRTISGNSTYILDSPIIIRYFFEKEQRLLIEIFENSKKYIINTTLGCIMGSKNNTFERKLSPTKNETLIIQAGKLKDNEDVINLKFEIEQNRYINFREEKNKLYYEVYSDIILYRSECLNEKSKFNPVKIPINLFKSNTIKILFKIKKQIINEYNLNLYEFEKQKIFNVNINNLPLKIISKSKLTKNYTFIDYLLAGIEIGLSVAIDFTVSNGEPNKPSSLHYIHGNVPNQYERAIKACGNIVGYYDNDQLYPCFGFGAKVNNTPKKLFNLNFQEDPNISFIDGIIEAYHIAINKVILWGPTHFAPIIREMNKIIKEQKHKLKYHILMILTDGIIYDRDETTDELVEGSFLPLSVIIIGVGNADFTNMIYLDADENPLVNSKGVKSVRDLVQFVPFLKYESNPELLAMEVLEEIPRQIVEYYEQNNLDPRNLTL